MTYTVYDEFSGFGGTSQGVTAVPGVELVFAANHKPIAVEVHSLNFPHAEHYLGDVVRAPIETFPRADWFCSSPACPGWTDARGVKREFDKANQVRLFTDEDLGQEPDTSDAARSRALMEEVPRYLRAINLRGRPVLGGIVENVIQCRKWSDWQRWLREIRAEGHRVKLIALNSMHARGPRTGRAPQSRDRLYVAYWLASLGRDPDWAKWLRPRAYCPTCDRVVAAVQVFKRSGVDMAATGATASTSTAVPACPAATRKSSPTSCPRWPRSTARCPGRSDHVGVGGVRQRRGSGGGGMNTDDRTMPSIHQSRIDSILPPTEVTDLLVMLGAHHTGWLSDNTEPLFVSDRRLRVRKTMPRAATSWALDSSGFTELSTYGDWSHGPTPAQYAVRVRRYRDEIGHLQWAAPQDWMCEPFITGKTGLTIAQHQARTVGNLLELRALAPDLPWIPVIQGYAASDYLACVERYAAAGIDLTVEPLVGLGSVCRRQATGEAAEIVTQLRLAGVSRLHGFRVKTSGLLRYGHLLASADSLAWSFAARRSPALPDCKGHKNCANCHVYATRWRERLLGRLGAATVQPTLWQGGGPS